MAGQKPRQGWVYMVDPSRVILTCKNRHSRAYTLTEHGEVNCKVDSCNLTINSSHITRGRHPYVVVTSNEYQDEISRIPTLVAIPLTTQLTFVGLPDVYPINKTIENGLDSKSYALVHQVRVIDATCFKDFSGSWMPRIGQLSLSDKEAIKSRLQYVLGIEFQPSDDWLRQNSNPELLLKIYGHLSKEEQATLLENLLENLK